MSPQSLQQEELTGTRDAVLLKTADSKWSRNHPFIATSRETARKKEKTKKEEKTRKVSSLVASEVRPKDSVSDDQQETSLAYFEQSSKTMSSQSLQQEELSGTHDAVLLKTADSKWSRNHPFIAE